VPDEPRRNRFQRALRVVSRAHFERAYKRGQRARGDVLVVVAVGNGLTHPRLGLSVGRVIWRGAVQRNRVRRVFREAFRLTQHELPAGFDFVLIPARSQLEPELEATKTELVRLAHKAAERWRAKQVPEAPTREGNAAS
jgi:ribonuclease P protein component